MGAKSWMLAYVDGDAKEILNSYPKLDRAATERLAKQLFPDEKLTLLKDTTLDYITTPDDEIVIGCFPGLSIVAAKEFAINCPSKLEPRFLQAGKNKTVYLYVVYSVVSWFAYAIWENGKLKRSLSIAAEDPDAAIIEDIGEMLAFEKPFWSGQHPSCEPEEYKDYKFSFHPLELGEAALFEMFGYVQEGENKASHVNPEKITLMRFKRPKPWWKFW